MSLCMVSGFCLVFVLIHVCFYCRYAMSFAGNYLKSIYVKRSPETNKNIHVVSSALKATLTWHNMRTLQVNLVNAEFKFSFSSISS